MKGELPMIGLVVHLAIAFLVLGLIWWIITLIPLPPPFPMIARVVLTVIAVIILLDLLLSIGGTGWRPIGLYSW